MEAIEYLKLATDKTEAGDLIKENNLTDAVVKLMSNYAEFIVKNCSIPVVVRQSELLCDNPHCEDGIVDRDMYGHPIYCQVCDSHN